MDLLQLSQNIRSLRQAQNLTVEQLAVKSGFSKGFISQVENFRLTPSLKALNKLAAALGIGMAELFQPETPQVEYSFGRLDGGEEVSRNESEKYGMRYHALAYRQIGRRVDPFLIEYTPASAERDFMMHDTEEFYLLLEGELDFFIMDDRSPRRMKAGDTLYMKANLPHRVRLAEGCDYARALTVYSEHIIRMPS